MTERHVGNDRKKVRVLGKERKDGWNIVWKRKIDSMKNKEIGKNVRKGNFENKERNRKEIKKEGNEGTSSGKEKWKQVW